MAARDRTIALLGALALVLLLVVGIGYAYLDGRDIASFAPTLLGFATPTIVALFAAAGVSRNMSVIEDKVNGNYDELSKRNELLTAKLTDATGAIPAVVTQRAPAYSSPEAGLPPYSPVPPSTPVAPDPPPPWVDPYPPETTGRHRLGR